MGTIPRSYNISGAAPYCNGFAAFLLRSRAMRATHSFWRAMRDKIGISPPRGLSECCAYQYSGHGAPATNSPKNQASGRSPYMRAPVLCTLPKVAEMFCKGLAMGAGFP